MVVRLALGIILAWQLLPLPSHLAKQEALGPSPETVHVNRPRGRFNDQQLRIRKIRVRAAHAGPVRLHGLWRD